MDKMQHERSREDIYEDILIERPYVLRHEYTERVWEVMDALLSELVEIQKVEASNGTVLSGYRA